MFQVDKNIVYNELSKPKIIDTICQSCPKDKEDKKGLSGSMVYGLLNRGFATTIGNALRRTILSSCYGVAVVGFNINNISHEFNNIVGISEDIIDIGLNLKKLRFIKNHTSFQGFVSFSVQGPCRFTAGMLEDLCKEKVKVVDKDHLICNIFSDAVFNFSFQIAHGRGYLPASFFSCFDNQRNLIFLDAIFSGVTKVSIDIENVVSGNSVNMEKLILNVDTDGSVDYKEVISDAALSLNTQFNPMILSSHNFETSTSVVGDLESEDASNFIVSSSGIRYNTNLFRTIHEIVMPVRAHNAFVKANVTYLGDLVKMPLKDLTSMANLGKKSLETVVEILKKFGLKLDMDVSSWPPADLCNLRKQCELRFNLNSENNEN